MSATTSASASSSSSSFPTTCKGHVKPLEERLSSHLWVPVSLVLVYVWVLQAMFREWRREASIFKECSIVVPLVMTSTYLAFIYFGKKWMAKREAFRIKDYMFTYNLYQTILNTWWVISMVKEVYDIGMPIMGIPESSSSFKVSLLVWVHYNNKYTELLDTVFMVLRKKNEQISFLHVYHHVLLIWAWWAVVSTACYGDAYFGSTFNSIVHIFMYSYYLLSLVGIPCPWKKLLTQFQLIQFTVCFCHAFYAMYAGHFPVWLCWLQIYVMVNMLVLFIRFYRQKYTPAQKKSQ